MNLFLNRESPVPIHDQLCAQVGQLVASGAIAAGDRLPSIRGLAARLGIHPNTVLAAYKTLAARGVLSIQKGSGVRVAAHAPEVSGWREGLALKAMAAQFVGQARSRGHDAEVILAACREALSPAPIRRVVVVNPHPDLQALYRHELAQVLSLPIAGMTPEELESAAPEALEGACFVTSTNFAAALHRTLGADRAPVIVTLAPAEPMIARVRALPPEAVVGVVSASPRFVFLMKELLAAVLDEARLLGADADEPERLASVLRLSSLVVTDAACHRAVADRCRVAIHVQPLLAETTFAALTERLPPEVFL